MYRLIIVTAIGNYVVEMTPEQEKPTNDDLLKLFSETKADVEAGCFMEGWTPTDNLKCPPGVFCLGDGLDILAYHVERGIDTIAITPESATPKEDTPVPFRINTTYLDNSINAKCVRCPVNGTQIIVCYSVNGEPPTDVLDADILTGVLCEEMKHIGYLETEYLLTVLDDGKPRNFSQAAGYIEVFKEELAKQITGKTAKAWTGWKEDQEI